MEVRNAVLLLCAGGGRSRLHQIVSQKHQDMNTKSAATTYRVSHKLQLRGLLLLVVTHILETFSLNKPLVRALMTPIEHNQKMPPPPISDHRLRISG